MPLLGLAVALSDLAGIGLLGLVVVALSFTATLFGARWLGRRMGISTELSLLIGTGYASCGVSAAAAMTGWRDSSSPWLWSQWEQR